MKRSPDRDRTEARRSSQRQREYACSSRSHFHEHTDPGSEQAGKSTRTAPLSPERSTPRQAA